MTKSSKKSTAKPKAARRTDADEEYRNKMDYLMGLIAGKENYFQASLKNNEYIRATHIVEAPSGGFGGGVCGHEDDGSHDCHIFLAKGAFEFLKSGLEKSPDDPVITFVYSPEDWKKRLAA
jgi:hypothetical protein